RGKHRARRPSAGGGLVDVDDPPVLVRDLAGGRVPPQGAPGVALHRVPEDRATDGEAAVAIHRRGGPQPLVNLGVVGAAAEHDAGHPVAPVGPGLAGDAVAVVATVDALD